MSIMPFSNQPKSTDTSRTDNSYNLRDTDRQECSSIPESVGERLKDENTTETASVNDRVHDGLAVGVECVGAVGFECSEV